jgi:hypothetical protein
MGMLPFDLVGVPVIGQTIQRNFNDFGFRPRNHGHAVRVDLDMRVFDGAHRDDSSWWIGSLIRGLDYTLCRVHSAVTLRIKPRTCVRRSLDTRVG